MKPTFWSSIRSKLKPRLSLRTLLVLITIISLGLGWRAMEVKRHRDAIQELTSRQFWLSDFYPDPIGPNWLYTKRVLRNLEALDDISTREYGGGFLCLQEPAWCTAPYSGLSESDLQLIAKVRGVHTLVLWDSQMPSSLLPELAEIPELRSLYIQSSTAPPVDETIISLSKIKHLERLLIQLDLPYPDDFVERLREALPNCRVATVPMS